MTQTWQLTAVIHREGDQSVALCPELDVVSQGETIEAARLNLIEALELFFEAAPAEEVNRRWSAETYVTSAHPVGRAGL
jgi:predicted RNase H-like HicB family nuclease